MPYLRCLGQNLPPAILAGGLGTEHGQSGIVDIGSIVGPQAGKEEVRLVIAPGSAVRVHELPDWMGSWLIDESGILKVERCGLALPREVLTRQDAVCLARGVAVAEDRHA